MPSPCPICQSNAQIGTNGSGWIYCSDRFSCPMRGVALHPDAWEALPRSIDGADKFLAEFDSVLDELNSILPASLMNRLSAIRLRLDSFASMPTESVSSLVSKLREWVAARGEYFPVGYMYLHVATIEAFASRLERLELKEPTQVESSLPCPECQQKDGIIKSLVYLHEQSKAAAEAMIEASKSANTLAATMATELAHGAELLKVLK